MTVLRPALFQAIRLILGGSGLMKLKIIASKH